MPIFLRKSQYSVTEFTVTTFGLGPQAHGVKTREP